MSRARQTRPPSWKPRTTSSRPPGDRNETVRSTSRNGLAWWVSDARTISAIPHVVVGLESSSTGTPADGWAAHGWHGGGDERATAGAEPASGWPGTCGVLLGLDVPEVRPGVAG